MDLELVCTAFGVRVPNVPEYIDAVADILRSSVFLSMDSYIQHGSTSCMEHCVAVSYLSWRAAARFGLSAREAARGALLHDMFLYDWHSPRKRKGWWYHGFSHPRAALNNARREFALTKREENVILRHMWPLTVIPPKCRVGYIVSFYDKLCSVFEAFGRPVLRHKVLYAAGGR